MTKRIIPCLDVRDGRVVKGKNFSGLQDVASPVDMAEFYNAEGADELVFYDITASSDGRALFRDVLESVASKVFIPLMVGGAINGLEDFERVLGSGADKVSVNSGAIRNPKLIGEASRRYGSQCVVLSIDCKREDGRFTVYANGGRIKTDIDALEWARRGESDGAGELVLNSIDTDGVRTGFDIELTAAVCDIVGIPVIASGGAGKAEHFAELFESVPGVGAGLAASIFHNRELGIPALKRFLAERGTRVRCEI